MNVIVMRGCAFLILDGATVACEYFFFLFAFFPHIVGAVAGVKANLVRRNADELPG